MDYKWITECRVCGSRKLRKYLDLGNQPLANALLESRDSECKKYPLQVLFCEECSLSQLSVVVNRNILYENYPYHSSVSSTFKAHCSDMAKSIRGMFKHPKTYDGWDGPQPNPVSGKPIDNLLMIDIASNDGCLIEQFKANGFNVMGIEPSKNLADEANRKDLRTVCEFWDEKGVGWITPADVITATNVFAHVDDVHGFLKLAKKKLRAYSNGFIVIEVPWLKNLIEKNQFDTIYHEHLSYFLLKPIKRLAKDLGMSVFMAEELDIHGGSLRVYISPWEREEHESVGRIMGSEEESGLYSYKTYKDYSSKVNSVKDHLMSLLEELNMGCKKVVGYGASAKGIMLMNYCGIDDGHLDYVVDDTKMKQGKFIPGCGIKIVPKSKLKRDGSDYILLLSWNFENELKENTRSVGAKYITPIPMVRLS